MKYRVQYSQAHRRTQEGYRDEGKRKADKYGKHGSSTSDIVLNLLRTIMIDTNRDQEMGHWETNDIYPTINKSY